MVELASVEAAAPPQTVLELREVTLLPRAPRQFALRELTLTLRAGELALLRLEPGRESLPLAAAAQGLHPADHGTIRFDGHPWTEDDPWNEAHRRGQIGRVFEGWGWVSNLTVLENVLLREHHHTTRPDAEILAEADRWAQRFGLERVPRGRPAFLPAVDLRRCEWVRALLGRPRLLLLERPEWGAPSESVPAFVEAVDEVRRQGTAVLWMTGDAPIWRRAHPGRVERFELLRERVRPAGGAP